MTASYLIIINMTCIVASNRCINNKSHFRPKQILSTFFHVYVRTGPTIFHEGQPTTKSKLSNTRFRLALPSRNYQLHCNCLLRVCVRKLHTMGTGFLTNNNCSLEIHWKSYYRYNYLIDSIPVTKKVPIIFASLRVLWSRILIS